MRRCQRGRGSTYARTYVAPNPSADDQSHKYGPHTATDAAPDVFSASGAFARPDEDQSAYYRHAETNKCACDLRTSHGAGAAAYQSAYPFTATDSRADDLYRRILLQRRRRM